MKLVLASDHAGYEYKEILKKYLDKNKIEYKDFGTNTKDSCDYPDFIHPACNSIKNKEYNFGIFICGSGNGVSMTANKYKEIRSAICWEVELAKLAREHNNANVLSIPSRFISKDIFIKIVNSFLNTDFEGGRHQNRVDKISNF